MRDLSRASSTSNPSRELRARPVEEVLVILADPDLAPHRIKIKKKAEKAVNHLCYRGEAAISQEISV